MIFDGKTALVTGASRGIGRAIAELLAEHGAQVVGTATSSKGVETISNYLDVKGKSYVLNVIDAESINSALSKIRAECGEIDILVNNAGITSDNLLLRMKEEEWRKVIDINLTSIFSISKFIIRAMVKKRYGRIISVGSVVGTLGNIGQANYAASKAGVVAFSKSLAREVATRGITVNVISPGFIETDMTRALTDAQRESILSSVPMNRFGDAKEIANAVLFLASDAASYITGETLHVNGGMCMI